MLIIVRSFIYLREKTHQTVVGRGVGAGGQSL